MKWSCWLKIEISGAEQMFGPITVPYEAVMLYNVCKLKEGIEWSEDLEFAIGEMCNVVRVTYDDFIAG